MSVRKCPKCGSVWYTALVKCAFCGVEGEEVKGPISPAKLNISHGGVSTAPSPDLKQPEPPARTPTPVEAPEALPPPPAAPPIETVAPPPPVPKPEMPAATAEQPSEPAEKPVDTPEKPLRPVRAQVPRQVTRDVLAAAPAPGIPSAIVPLVFASLGTTAGIILPFLWIFRRDRVAEILALLAFAILSPFAPFGWMAGQRYLDLCRGLGFAPASLARSGRILGMIASFVLVLEISTLSILIAVAALSGKAVCPLWK